jgi:hypothetical protein
VISQATGEKSLHEGAGFEADTDPLAFCRTIDDGRCGLWSTEREKALSSQSRDRHLETVGGNREESVRTIAVAAPNPFNKRMIGGSFFEMDELAPISYRFI